MENNFNRFLEAQELDYDLALNEIKRGYKSSHWIWSIFPQLKGFGHSFNSEFYGIDDAEEALAYYEHPVLGSRLKEITRELLNHPEKSILEIMGSGIDVLKLKSSMTLFWRVTKDPLFEEVLDTFYEGREDRRTLSRLEDPD